MTWPRVFCHVVISSPVIGQSGCLSPSVNTLTMPIPNMTYDAMEECLRGFDLHVSRVIKFFDHKFRSFVAVLKDFESGSVECSLTVFPGLEFRAGCEVWMWKGRNVV